MADSSSMPSSTRCGPFASLLVMPGLQLILYSCVDDSQRGRSEDGSVSEGRSMHGPCADVNLWRFTR